MITINGTNVSINAVEEAINNFSGVQLAAVVAQSSTDGEFELYAAIALEDSFVDQSEFAQILRNSLQAALGKAAVPRNFAFFDSLPTLPNNKIDRRAITQLTHDGALWQR